jgi:hypothetical protein
MASVLSVASVLNVACALAGLAAGLFEVELNLCMASVVSVASVLNVAYALAGLAAGSSKPS